MIARQGDRSFDDGRRRRQRGRDASCSPGGQGSASPRGWDGCVKRHGKVKDLLRRGRGRKLARTADELTPVVRGWIGYFRLAEAKGWEDGGGNSASYPITRDARPAAVAQLRGSAYLMVQPYGRVDAVFTGWPAATAVNASLT